MTTPSIPKEAWLRLFYCQFPNSMENHYVPFNYLLFFCSPTPHPMALVTGWRGRKEIEIFFSPFIIPRKGEGNTLQLVLSHCNLGVPFESLLFPHSCVGSIEALPGWKVWTVTSPVPGGWQLGVPFMSPLSCPSKWYQLFTCSHPFSNCWVGKSWSVWQELTSSHGSNQVLNTSQPIVSPAS